MSRGRKRGRPAARSETSARVGVRSTDAARKTSTKSANRLEADDTPAVHDTPAARADSALNDLSPGRRTNARRGHLRLVQSGDEAKAMRHHDTPAVDFDTSDHRYVPDYLQPPSREFDPVEALQSIHRDAENIDALADATRQAAARLPRTTDREARFASALVRMVADQARTMSCRTHDMQAALQRDRTAPAAHDIPAHLDPASPAFDLVKAQLDPASPAFSPVEALQSLHLDAVDLDALAEAASHAVGELRSPADWSPADRDARFAYERFYGLVSKVADEARVNSRRTHNLQLALSAYLRGR